MHDDFLFSLFSTMPKSLSNLNLHFLTKYAKHCIGLSHRTACFAAKHPVFYPFVQTAKPYYLNLQATFANDAARPYRRQVLVELACKVRQPLIRFKRHFLIISRQTISCIF